MTDEPQVNQHIQANQQLNDTPCMLVFSDKQKDTQRNGQPDVAEVKQIEYFALCQPQSYRNGFKEN